MIAELNNALKFLLYSRGQIDPADVDISFQMPTREWVDSLIHPTINLFLFDTEENTDLRQTSMQTTRSASGATHRMPPRRFDMHFMVSALTTVVEDQSLLLWRTLATLLKYTPLPMDVLPGTMLATLIRNIPFPDEVWSEDVAAALQAPVPLPVSMLHELRPHLESRFPTLATRVGKIDGNSVRALDLWGALEIPPRPALLYTVTLPMDLEIAVESKLVLTRTMRINRSSAEDERSGNGIDRERAIPVVETIMIGGTARNRQGTPLANLVIGVEGSAAEARTDDQGRFSLKVAPGEIRLRVAQEGRPPTLISLHVPSESYDIALD